MSPSISASVGDITSNRTCASLSAPLSILHFSQPHTRSLRSRYTHALSLTSVSASLSLYEADTPTPSLSLLSQPRSEFYGQTRTSTGTSASLMFFLLLTCGRVDADGLVEAMPSVCIQFGGTDGPKHTEDAGEGRWAELWPWMEGHNAVS